MSETQNETEIVITRDKQSEPLPVYISGIDISSGDMFALVLRFAWAFLLLFAMFSVVAGSILWFALKLIHQN